MPTTILFTSSLRRLAAYVCLGAGVLSVSQLPIITIITVHAQEAEAVAENTVEPVVEESAPDLVEEVEVVESVAVEESAEVVAESELTDMSDIFIATTTKEAAVDALIVSAPLASEPVQARIIFSAVNNNGGNLTDTIFLGSSGTTVAAGEWFNVYENGAYFTHADISGYEDVSGLAVQLNNDKVRVLLHGSHATSGWKEHVSGYVEFSGATVVCQEGDTSDNTKLENGFTGTTNPTQPGNDEVWVTGSATTKSHFSLTVDTADDGFYTQFDIQNSGDLCPTANIIEEVVAPQLISINPTSGATSTPVTITGTGFTATGNTVDFGGITIPNINSTDGTTLNITVPANATLGLKFISVENANGVSNELDFIVTDGSTQPPQTGIQLISINPTSGATSTPVTITGTGFTATGNTVDFGGVVINGATSTDGTTLNITVPANATLGLKFISVENANGVSNEINFTVTATNNGGGDDDDDDDDQGGGGGGSSGSRPRATSTSTPATGGVGGSTDSCPVYLTEYIGDGHNASVDSILKLQKFLADEEGMDVPQNGVYDAVTRAAVMAFQTKYADDILTPWGITEPTGHVFITTTLKINLLWCKNNQGIDLDLRNFYPAEAAPGVDLIDDVDTTVDGEPLIGQAPATSTNLFQLAAAGVLDFLGIYPWWWWLLVIVLIIVISWLLKKTDDEDDQDGQNGNSTNSVNTGYVPTITP